jgi:tRNA-dihydrouridine synthase A
LRRALIAALLVPARAWRRHPSENVHKHGAGPEVVAAALAMVPRVSTAEAAA